ncbi:MAG: nucleoside recognition protein [Lachnospiraceae bacterium]|nr:nucleoside recognition protein [Lachnospiraceae bacterium]
MNRLLPILLLILLLIWPSYSIQGAQDGLLLWFQIVLPTLSPFMIVTQLIAASGGIRLLMRPFSPFLRRLFGLSYPGGYVLLCGLLCGYPLGARLCADFAARGIISRNEARYLLAICNHPSPMFLLGYVQKQLPAPISPALLLACLYLPVFPLSWLARAIYFRNVPSDTEKQSADHASDTIPDSAQNVRSTLEEILMSTCDTMVIIGGYIMIFSILSSWIGQMDFLPVRSQALLSGLAEITTGIHQICRTWDAEQCLLPVIGIAAFGGCSGIFQTRSVIAVSKNAGLSIRHYVIWKAVHAFLSCVIMLLLQELLLPRL